MPSAVSASPAGAHGITKLTNCRLVRGDRLVSEDLWISAATGKIVRGQAAFYDDHVLPDQTIDLGGRIVAPGLIDVQLNGAFGFNFSTLFGDEENGPRAQYCSRLRDLNRKLFQTGVTSYVPTVTSQTSELYRKVIPFLAPTGSRMAEDGAESLGAHVEGPFLSPTKNGVHNTAVLRVAETFADVEAMYGAENLAVPTDTTGDQDNRRRLPAVRMITAAPELGHMTDVVFPELSRRGIVCSIGHTEASYEEAAAAMHHGATMITHLFNAMRPLHHRNPGVFGVLGEAPTSGNGSSSSRRPYYGVISDGIHLHPTTVKIAYNAHPEGFLLVTDAMHMVGCPDGPYSWTNGDREVRLNKTGKVLLLENSTTIAGSTTTLIECLENFVNWTGTDLPRALRTVTSTPAAMLGLQGVKGTLDPGADADLIILSTNEDLPSPGGSPTTRLHIDEVWKFGTRVHKRE
ncbi:n-acetylglucosamine-6-phosphate deacetylase [Grosmannia clavigera kw1407]|uniref:N-acetylglucosamine-6-phosphate deacetylase n=1 Tax=Grosmannia clavigera (strain kw1407 / UAMH 11150) TaxID=655863 RepID=F0XLD2_GROCL|nr:n-acetylglucosamine-6-phosphate deacetylase [Grosmannia clavigera kw1407]EFX01275.1 n-acetylglucosamine-6-phosphate deacetylase [Grosmannia clavigera kw1407]